MKPRLLDLFCGAGGAAVGYHRAGFEVVGVDIKPQPHYPFEFHQADAMTFPLKGFDAIHASPPCQAYSMLRHLSFARNGKYPDYPKLLEPTRDRLQGSSIPWVIENVPGAPIKKHLVLCGSAFGLRVRRHRIFETSLGPLLGPQCQHDRMDFVGVYGRMGDGRRLWSRTATKRWKEKGGKSMCGWPDLRAANSVEEAQEAMDIHHTDDWREIAEAIPPAYTEFIGRQLIRALEF